MVRYNVNHSFDNYYTESNENSSNVEVDLLQSSFECCGTDSKQYWYSRKDYKDHLPLSCCRKAVEYRGPCGATNVSDSEDPFNRGCQSALNDFLQLFTGLLAGILIFAAVIKPIAACCAIFLANYFKD